MVLNKKPLISGKKGNKKAEGFDIMSFLDVCSQKENLRDREKEQIEDFKSLLRSGRKFDFGSDNERIYKEMIVEDILDSLGKLKDCKGTININYEKGIPTYMKVNFEEIEENGTREKYTEFVDNAGFVTYKKLPPNHSKIVGEKDFKYTLKKKNMEEIPTHEGEDLWR